MAEHIDYLTEILRVQDILNARVGVSQSEAKQFDEDKLSLWIQRYVAAAQRELSEVWEACYKARWWRNYDSESEAIEKARKEFTGNPEEFDPKQVETWKKEVAEELGDVLHFTYSACLLLGMTSEDVYNVYMKKNHKNLTGRGHQWSYKHPTD